MRYIKNPSHGLGKLDKIDFGNGKVLSCDAYWNDDTSFALDIGDGELKDSNKDKFFIHVEYNKDDNEWYYVFEIWFDDDCTYDINKFKPEYRDEYLTEAEMKGLKEIIRTLVEEYIKKAV
jgi:hypothetical protein